MNRWECIGFRNLESEASLLQVLSDALHKSHSVNSNTFICRPFEACELVIQLDKEGDPECVEISLTGFPQAFIFQQSEKREHSYVIRGFSCLDGSPLFPIEFICSNSISDDEVGNLKFVELSAYSSELKPSDKCEAEMSVECCEESGVMDFHGVLLNQTNYENKFTHEMVILSKVFVPGMIIPICTQKKCEIVNGSMVEGRIKLFGNVFENNK